MFDIIQVTYRMWKVSSPEREYMVWCERGKWKCGCPIFLRNKSCIHIRSVWDFLKEEMKNKGTN